MQHIGLVVVVVAFWVFLAVASVAGIIGDYKKRRIELEPLRTAMERGGPLDAAVVEKLMTREQHTDGLDPLQLRVGGIITIASGVGIALLSFFVFMLRAALLYPLLGAGVLVVCVGAGLLLAARAVERARDLAGRRADGTGPPA
jgi:hypothetical protein